MESSMECDAWLVDLDSLDACETSEELLDALFSTETDNDATGPSALVASPPTTREHSVSRADAAADCRAQPHPASTASVRDPTQPHIEEENVMDPFSKPTKPSKRKRRTACRPKQTLDELRQTVRESEAFLALLQSRKRGEQAGDVSIQPPNRSEALVATQQLLAWKEIASRQYRWRRESEKANQQLRVAVDEQIKIIQGLEKLLKRSQNTLASTTPITHSLTDIEGSRYARRIHELMVVTSEMLRHAHDVPTQPTELGDWISSSPNGDIPLPVASMSHSRHVPCASSNVTSVLWKYFAQAMGESESYFRERIDVSSDTVIKSFHVHWTNCRGLTNHRGIVVARRVRQSDGLEVIVYTAEMEALDATSTVTGPSGFRTHGWNIVHGCGQPSQGEKQAKMTEIRFKTVSNAITCTNSSDLASTVKQPPAQRTRDTRMDVNQLVQFSLSRHNERVQRTIDDIMLSAC